MEKRLESVLTEDEFSTFNQVLRKISKELMPEISVEEDKDTEV